MRGSRNRPSLHLDNFNYYYFVKYNRQYYNVLTIIKSATALNKLGGIRERNMRKLNGFVAASAVLMNMGMANAADLYIDGNQPIPGSDISNISINPVTGNIFVTTKTGYVVTPDDAPPPPPDAVSITNFSASPLSISKGNSTALSWSTQNASACTLSSNVPGLSLPGVGRSSVGLNVVIDVTGTYVFTLRCSDSSGGQDTKNVGITVTTVTPNSSECTDYQSPLGNGSIVTWSDFWATPYPGPVSASVTTNVPRRSYLAIEFNTGDIPNLGKDSGAFGNVESTATSGRRLGSVSRCPGDYDVADECQQYWGEGQTLIWSTEGYNGACQLEPNTTYYFNLSFTDGIDPNSSQCIDSTCQTLLRHYNPR
jgi:hypothetical protein